MPPPKKRIKVSDKRAAIKALQAGSTVEQLAARYGVSAMTIRNWSDTYGTPVSPQAPATPASLQQSVLTVSLPPEVEKPEEQAGEGGYNAARAAAGLGPEPDPQAAPPPPEEPKPEAPKIDPAEGLIFMSKIGLQLSVRFYAAKLKVKLTDQVKELGKLTDEEEKQLETYAPFAAPYISEMITKYGPIIGAGIYGFIYFTMLTDRFAALKELAPKKEVEGQAAVK
jgi:transposase-like protein